MLGDVLLIKDAIESSLNQVMVIGKNVAQINIEAQDVIEGAVSKLNYTFSVAHSASAQAIKDAAADEVKYLARYLEGIQKDYAKQIIEYTNNAAKILDQQSAKSSAEILKASGYINSTRLYVMFGFACVFIPVVCCFGMIAVNSYLNHQQQMQHLVTKEDTSQARASTLATSKPKKHRKI